MKRVLSGFALATALATSAPAFADEPRPSEGDLFGAPQTETPASESSTPAAQAPAQSNEQSRDNLMLGDANAATVFSADTAPPDPLTIGGLIYLRSQSSARQGQSPHDWSFSTPTLVDGYFDARPNDRVRGFLLARLSYDPTLPQTANEGTVNGQVAGTGSSQGSPSLSSLFQQQTRAPRVIIDQLWLRFDIKHRVFVTAGKQHVRWGTARFWAPGDFLHIRRRNPLDVFDARAGTTMLKLHMPVESKGWNFYAYALTEGAGPTTTVGTLAGAARAEFVLGQSELGLGGLLQEGRKPKTQADFSIGIGPFDLYGEVAIRYGSEVDRVRYDENATLPMTTDRPPWQSEADWRSQNLSAAVQTLFPSYRKNGVQPQTVGGLTYSLQYADKDVLTLGAEYFYNPLGYDTPKAYPGLVLPRTAVLADPATFFFLGRHYAALFASLPAPFNLDLHTFTVSTIGNLSDQSFISRFDYAYTLLTHMRLEAFASVRYGREQGEFRFGTSGINVGTQTFSLKPSLFDLGVALRVSI
ncbi:MAG: hypothetical protein SF187_08285 [Deltaproteobacteria bacterium]|nr:hypothetical protein [Deltaproteobacteria bacterium]